MRAAVRWSFFRNDRHSPKPRFDVIKVGFLLCRLLHQGEEQADLDRLDLDVAQFVDEQAIVGQIVPEHLLFGVVGHGPEQFRDSSGTG